MLFAKSISSYLPMSEAAYYILLSLCQPRHGYGIMQHVEGITNGRIKLGAGTVYGNLSKMEKDRLIKFEYEQEKRKYYSLTEEGHLVLKSEIERITELYNNSTLYAEKQ